ncbi:MAG: hypothetical protein JHD16_05710, partial [Solirubrobacteraceae bacterium]|nr:hypothetical protein [Solirubrobacteraceae bacterium]
ASYKFAVHLIPALADSLVGRSAPLGLWVPVESLISTFITPLVAMTIALWYLQLSDRPEAAPALAPNAPMPLSGLGRPTFVRPGTAR